MAQRGFLSAVPFFFAAVKELRSSYQSQREAEIEQFEGDRHRHFLGGGYWLGGSICTGGAGVAGGLPFPELLLPLELPFDPELPLFEFELPPVELPQPELELLPEDEPKLDPELLPKPELPPKLELPPKVDAELPQLLLPKGLLVAPFCPATPIPVLPPSPPRSVWGL